MKSHLNVALLQTELHWENPEANYAHFNNLLSGFREQADIIALPEMFTTGFSMTPSRIAEPYSDTMQTLQWMKKWAAQHDAVVTGSVAVEENGKYYNRLFWVRPDGTYSTYNKRHLFRMAGENEVYEAGQKLLIEEWKGWKICPLICYDLRFPVWSRNRMKEGRALYDVLLYVANWPGARRDPWMKLALARAIENQVYVATVNRIGRDGNDLEYAGDSALIDPRGNYVTPNDSSERILFGSFDRDALLDFREKFPVLEDADAFDIR